MNIKESYTAITPFANVSRVAFYLLGRTFFPRFLSGTFGLICIWALVFEALMSTVVTLSLHAGSYPITERSLRRLAALYIHIIFNFASVFLLLLALSSASSPSFRGMHGPWEPSNPSVGRQLINILLSYIDCIHFSVVTIATVGYGDITPVAWYAKLVTDLEILIGVALVVVGVSRYFFLLSRTADRG